MSNPDLQVVILAAGVGKRMKSSTIKVLHRAGGRPILDYVLDLANEVAEGKPILVIGHQREAVREHVGDRADFVVQDEQLGTGHAVLQTEAAVRRGRTGAGRVLVLSGDVPLTRPETLRRLAAEHDVAHNEATLLSMQLEEPALYGRIIRGANGEVTKIVEARDANDAQLTIREVNTGIYLFESESLFDQLRQLSSKNAQGEHYVTDVIGNLRREGKRVGAILADPIEALGVNSRADLSIVEAELNRRTVERLMTHGVTFRNPQTVTLDTTVSIEADTVVYPFVCLEGETRIGRDCVIEPGVHLRNVVIGDDVVIRTGVVAEDAVIENSAHVGPYAHLRPGTRLGESTKIGNFVETKKAVFGRGAKASHLSYIGDAEVGANVNIGAGTITCNYDGVNKNTTIIEDGAFIGSDTQLVAPVRVGRGAYVGAGTTVTKDVPPDSLALSRVPQRIVENWASKRRSKTKK
jgi:bifunctional UDP-N-acetylglucosamine pyrophosphorylase/glucosamine-1-phosphate N-acetyltransferase